MDNTRWFTFINYLSCRWQEVVIAPLEYIGNGVGTVGTTFLGALIDALECLVLRHRQLFFNSRCKGTRGTHSL